MDHSEKEVLSRDMIHSVKLLLFRGMVHYQIVVLFCLLVHFTCRALSKDLVLSALSVTIECQGSIMIAGAYLHFASFVSFDTVDLSDSFQAIGTV